MYVQLTNTVMRVMALLVAAAIALTASTVGAMPDAYPPVTLLPLH